MKAKSKIIIVLIVIIILIMIVSGCVGGNGRNDDKRAQGKSQKDVENLLVDAAEMLDRTAPEPRVTSNSETPIRYGEPSDLEAYRSGSALPGAKIPSRNSDVSSRDSVEADTIDETRSPNEDVAQEEDSITRPYSWRSRASYSTTQKEDRSEKQDAQYEIKGFYSELYSWISGTKTADETRRKANEIREKADMIREDAKDLPLDKRDEAISIATTMEDYANRLSSTRGNTRKLNSLRHNISKNLEE